MKKLILIISLIFSSLLLFMCSDDSVVESNKIIMPISHISNGCHSQNFLGKENSEPFLDWEINNNMLSLSLLFNTHCGASYKDSIFAEDSLLEIFVSDTSIFTAKCSCQYKEEFILKVLGQNEINFKFYHKTNSKDEYNLFINEKLIWD